MDKNIKDPNRPRLWLENAQEFPLKSETSSASDIPPAVCTSEAAVQMMSDPDTREELLASLKGRKKPK